MVPKLETAGYCVTGVDPRKDGGSPTLQQWLGKSYNRLEQWDVVVHLAANIENVDARMKGGVGMYQDTVLDYEMAEYLEKHPPRECVVWMTSCAVDHPEDPYAWVKLNGEKLAGALAKQGVPVVLLRPWKSVV